VVFDRFHNVDAEAFLSSTPKEYYIGVAFIQIMIVWRVTGEKS